MCKEGETASGKSLRQKICIMESEDILVDIPRLASASPPR